LALRRPNGTLGELDLTDLSFTYDLGGRNSLLIGFSSGLERWARFGGTYNAKHGVTVEGLVRSRNGVALESSLTLRVRF
jgi:hypothetical protein